MKLNSQDFLKRPLAITDVETTGLDAQLHEIIEIGLIVVSQPNLKVLDEFEVKVKPVSIKTAVKKALEVNGYNEKEWRRAWDLREAIEIYSDKTRNAVFLAQNVYHDWSFINEAFKRTGVEDYMDYHRLDLFTIGWSKAEKFGLTKFSLASMCRQLGIAPESAPHRAMNGVRKNLEVLRKLSGF